MLERVYNVNLSEIYSMGRHRERAKKAIKLVREFARRHMKARDEKIVLGMDVNEYIWRNGMQKPPRRIRLKMIKDKEGTVMVMLEGATKEEKKEEAAKSKSREEKEAAKKKAVEKPAEGDAKKKAVEKPAEEAAKKKAVEKPAEKKGPMVKKPAQKKENK